ncbi:MAG TPA: hypothetical protein VM598_03775 [Bdellovibrionota bacterium]|nr:hypothetical protein [Bdellovibrionota bacterium]
MKQYEQYRVYYSDQIRRVDRIENRNRSREVEKLTYEFDRILLALLGQRNVDSIRWWALGSKSGISLADWLRKREAQRGVASR